MRERKINARKYLLGLRSAGRASSERAYRDIDLGEASGMARPS